MILGSDDLVSKEYLLESYNKIIIDNYDLCFSNLWLTYNNNTNNIYLQKYKVNKILGAGRVLSKKFLQSCNYRIYDPILKKCLDNLLTQTIENNKHLIKYKIHMINKPGILLYKGNWECLSDVNLLISAPGLNTKLLNKNNKETISIFNNFNIDLK